MSQVPPKLRGIWVVRRAAQRSAESAARRAKAAADAERRRTDALALAARRAEAAADAEAAAAAAAEARHAPDEGDAAAQAIFEAHPAFGVDWSSCRDSEAKGLAFVEERQPGPVRKYEFTYEQFCGPDNDMGYPQFDTVTRTIFLRQLGPRRPGEPGRAPRWAQCRGWEDYARPAPPGSGLGWFERRGLQHFVGNPERAVGGGVG